MKIIQDPVTRCESVKFSLKSNSNKNIDYDNKIKGLPAIKRDRNKQFRCENFIFSI